MKAIQFIIALILTAGLVYFLGKPIALNEKTTIPPLGNFFNPFSGFWQNANQGTPSNESFQFDELSAAVQVVYDDKGVPHIFADNIHDAVFVQGYLTAKDRLWQMDISSRAIGGYLSEVVGPKALAKDKQQRNKGLVYAAKNALKGWSEAPEDYQVVQAYTNGVNEYILNLAEKDYPIEFKLLDYKPTPWTMLKSALFIKGMAETLCMRNHDIAATKTLEHFGRATFDFLYPEQNPKQDPIISKGTEWDFTPNIKTDKTQPSKTLIGESIQSPFEYSDEGIGSNNWAVSGSKTASGHPILCNDPHLNLTLPSTWYEVQIKTKDINAYGVSFPGFPGVVIGFNEKVAWGMTNVGQDLLDWYTIKWVDDSKQEYYVDDEKFETNTVIEKIEIKGAATVFDTIRYTHWGPVVENEDGPDLAMRWIAHDEGANELDVFQQLSKAKNHSDYIKALRHYQTPPQNIVFASQDGDIALSVQGKFPIKTKEQGRFIQDGSVRANAWQGFIPFEHMPRTKNPERGFVSSANQHSTASDYPYYYNGTFADFRGRLINRKLEEMDKVTVQDMMALQNDNYSLKAEEFLPLLIAQLDSIKLTVHETECLDLLKNWDLKFNKDAVAPVLFELWFQEFYNLTWDEVLNKNENGSGLLLPEDWRTIALLEENPSDIFFDIIDTPKKETAKEICLQSFTKVVEFAFNASEGLSGLTWKNHRKIKIGHIGKINAFSATNLDVGGHSHSINALSNRMGPSWRMIVELDDPIKAYGVYPGGQSGNPGNPFYNSMLDHWSTGQYYELLLMKSADDYKERQLYSVDFTTSGK